MAYIKQTWSDGSAGGTPINASRLNYMETGIAAAQAFSDTGWVDMTPGVANGFTVGSDGARYRVVNGICYFQIHISASTAVATAIVYTLPPTARPAYTHWFTGQLSSAFKGEVKVVSSGAIAFGVANTPFVTSGSFPVG